jgi:hypothetical protein
LDRTTVRFCKVQVRTTVPNRKLLATALPVMVLPSVNATQIRPS